MAAIVFLLFVAVLAAEAIAIWRGFVPRRKRVNPFFAADPATTWSVPDPQLGWINKAGVARSIEAGQVPMTFWPFGRRASRAHEMPRPDGVPVMIIGGSNLQAYGVRDEETFVALLAQRFPQLWFENFGNGGYGTVQALLLAERALEQFYTTAKPGLILLALDDSHIMRNVAEHGWISSLSDRNGSYLVPPHYRMRGGESRFVPFRSLPFWPLEQHSALISLVHEGWIRRRYATSADAIPVTLHVIDRIARIAAERGSTFGIVVLEDRSGIASLLLQGRGYPHLDCSAVARADPRPFYIVGGFHPNAKLHAYFASRIGAWMETEFLPRLAPATPPSPGSAGGPAFSRPFVQPGS